MKSSVLSAQTTVQTELGSVIDLHNYSAAFRPITGNFLYVYVVCYAAVNVNKLIMSNPSFLHSGWKQENLKNNDMVLTKKGLGQVQLKLIWSLETFSYKTLNIFLMNQKQQIWRRISTSKHSRGKFHKCIFFKTS